MSPFALFAGQSQAAVAASAVGATKDGTPTRRFRKTIATVGTYVHPVDGWKLDVDQPRLDRWAAAFSAMRGNGVDVEQVVDHRHDAEAVRGYVAEMFREGDELVGVIEARGTAGIQLAETCRNVSPWIEPAWADGKGNKYSECITHVAWCQKPVIPGQRYAEAMAASLEGAKPCTPLILSTEGGANMDIAAILAELRTITGNGQLKAEEIPAGVSAAIAAANTKATQAATEAANLKAEIAQLRAAGAGKPKPDADTLEYAAEATAGRIDGLVTGGKVTPAMAASLKTLLVGEAGNRHAFALSGVYAGRPKPLAQDVLAIFEAMDPAQLKLGGTATGAQQPVALSQAGRGGTGDPAADAAAAADAKAVRESMAAAAWGKAK